MTPDKTSQLAHLRSTSNNKIAACLHTIYLIKNSSGSLIESYVSIPIIVLISDFFS